LAAVEAQCKAYGFQGYEGGEFGRTPDGSYGNAPSNVVYLYQLYPNHATDGLPAEARIGHVPIYIDGIGTRKLGPDSWYGMGTGQGKTGVIARVKQAPELIAIEVERFLRANPMVTIARIEFDIFGFSRGAAAARHCANEVLKPDHGVFAKLLAGNQFGVLASFDPSKDVSINFIGLFDTVGAIAAPLNLHFAVSDDLNPGVNLYLPPGCARQVVQLCARDEHRLNFGLNSVRPDHLEITMPGAHSDIGGGYLPRARERLVLKMRRAYVRAGDQVELQSEWRYMLSELEILRSTGLEGEGALRLEAWPLAQPPRGPMENRAKDYMLCILLDRPVRGELGLVALRVMREFGVLHGVPFDDVDGDKRFNLPENLAEISASIFSQAMEGKNVRLDDNQERLLRGLYIHRSAHFVSIYTLMVNKPTVTGVRNVFAHRPQKGYPQ
jgi:type VI secretion system secreted protein VgrG